MNMVDAMEQAQVFAARNLTTGAAELIAWQDTGLCPPDGTVKRLCSLLEPWHGQNAIGVARSLIERAALEYVAAGRQVTPPPGQIMELIKW